MYYLNFNFNPLNPVIVSAFTTFGIQVVELATEPNKIKSDIKHQQVVCIKTDSNESIYNINYNQYLFKITEL